MCAYGFCRVLSPLMSLRAQKDFRSAAADLYFGLNLLGLALFLSLKLPFSGKSNSQISVADLKNFRSSSAGSMMLSTMACGSTSQRDLKSETLNGASS